MENLIGHIRALEERLASRDGNANTFADLLDEHVLEIGRSGKIYLRPDILVALERGEKFRRVEISEFKLSAVDENTVLAVFRTSRPEMKNKRDTRRSSLWKCGDDGRWRLVFHQGTPL